MSSMRTSWKRCEPNRRAAASSILSACSGVLVRTGLYSEVLERAHGVGYSRTDRSVRLYHLAAPWEERPTLPRLISRAGSASYESLACWPVVTVGWLRRRFDCFRLRLRPA